MERFLLLQQNGSRISADIVDASLEIWKLKIPLPLRVKGGWLDFVYVDEVSGAKCRGWSQRKDPTTVAKKLDLETMG